MPAVSRLGDTCTGHGCFPARPNLAGSPSVFVNGQAAHRLGDAWVPHTCGNNTHAGETVGGSASVYVNGKPLARIGDDVSCGSGLAAGSANVFAGG